MANGMISGIDIAHVFPISFLNIKSSLLNSIYIFFFCISYTDNSMDIGNYWKIQNVLPFIIINLEIDARKKGHHYINEL